MKKIGPSDVIMAAMENNQPVSPRRRLQTLLAIPDNQRTEEQWDEIVELEIQLAPGNREDGPGRDMRTATPQQIRKHSQKASHAKPTGGGGNKPEGAGGGQKQQNRPRNKMRNKANKPKQESGGTPQ